MSLYSIKILQGHSKIIILAAILLFARTQNNYELLGLLFLIIFLILFSKAKNPEDKLYYFLFFQFFEYFELIPSTPLSVPYVIISIYILFNFVKNIYHFIIVFSSLVFCTAYSYNIASIYPIKLFLTFTIIYASCSGLFFLKSNNCFNSDSIYKQVTNFYYFLVLFWLFEAISYFLISNFKLNILVGNDYRPIGFFSEPTYFIFLIGTMGLILSRFYAKKALLALFLSIYSQSRIMTPFLFFYIIKKNFFLIFVLLIVLTLYFIYFLDNNSFFSRFFDFNDNIRLGLLSNAFSSISVESLLIPPNSHDLHKTGIFYLQLVNIFGGFLASMMFLYLSIRVVSKTGYVGLVIIITSFFHPIQYSAISLTALLLCFHFKNYDDKR